MSKIRILSEILTNKIAAGEVVERPGSVVKELLENSLDAGADSVSVEAAEGGKSLIRVSDNGCGMEPDDALLCLERYATSKIETDEDLFEIRTLGFRGEALPSIASVSSLALVTRTGESEAAAIIKVDGGKILSVSETGAPVGTSITVSRLFHNVPARRKFLKSAATELGHITDTVTSAALCRPDVSFLLTHNGREIFSWPKVADPAARAHAVLGHETGASLVLVDFSDPCARVSGYIAPEDVTKSTGRGLYVFVNGRVVADRLLMHAVMEAFSGRLTKGRYPVAVISVEVPFSEVDVNVHPAKAQVRFVKSREVHGAVMRAVEKALAQSAAARAPWGPSPSAPAAEPMPPAAPEDFPKVRAGNAKAAIAHDLGFGKAPAWPGLKSGAPWRKAEGSGGRSPEKPESLHQAPPSRPGGSSVAEPCAAFDAGAFSRMPSPAPPSPPVAATPQQRPSQEPVFREKPDSAPEFRVIGQIMHSFIVCESRDGLVLIDQHAAHERVMFEKFRARFLSGRIESMDLLFPETVTLSHAEADSLAGLVPELARLGLDIEPFSGNTFVVKAVPSFLGGKGMEELVKQLAEQALAMESRNDLTRILDECVALTACHGSVRAGQKLSMEEMNALAADLAASSDPAHCPHGRPTWTIRTLDEIYRDFKRK